MRPRTRRVPETRIGGSPASFDEINGLGTNSANASLSVSAEGISHVSCFATDVSGNSSTAAAAEIKIDTVAPSISASLDKTAAATGWFNIDTGAPTVSFSCSDATSGLAAACPASSTFVEGADQSRSETIYDNAGNSATDGVENIDVDLVAPTDISISGAVNYYFGDTPGTATCTADGGTSGLDSCTVTGYGEGAVGSYTATATATDAAGNVSTETTNYSVLAWTFSGFYQPVDMAGVVNTVKNGSGVPLKFEIFAGETELSDTSLVTMSAIKVGCTSGTTESEVELTTSGATSLRYDATEGQFIFNWKTPKAPNTCYDVTVTSLDGSSITAKFKLR
jgi:hypothetical protein